MTTPTRYRGNSGRRYTPTARIGEDVAVVRVLAHGTGHTPLPSVTFELRAVEAMALGVACIEAAALSRSGLIEGVVGDSAMAVSYRRYSAAPATRARVTLTVFDAGSIRVLSSLTDTMAADDATAYGLALIEAAVQSRTLLAATQAPAEVA